MFTELIAFLKESGFKPGEDFWIVNQTAVLNEFYSVTHYTTTLNTSRKVGDIDLILTTFHLTS